MNGLSHRNLFLRHLAQTSPQPVGLEIDHAKGIYLYTPQGQRYVDLISGVSVSNVGHSHPAVVNAVVEQAKRYMHTMVYGEHIQSPQLLFAQKLTSYLPKCLSTVYFVNSGSEANEGALKLAKRATGRTKIIYCKKSYHGSTHGALSVMGDETWKKKMRPLLPDVYSIEFNDFAGLEAIDLCTAAVIMEPVQAEAGVIVPHNEYLNAVRKKTEEMQSLLIFDEVQTGFGRLGTLFGFQLYNVVPDIITFAKAMGGGMPIGAFIASQELMNTLSNQPILGHISTFGGHPVSASAGLAAFNIIIEEKLSENAKQTGELFRKLLTPHQQIVEIRGEGLLLAIELGCPEKVKNVISLAFENKILLDMFLFCETAFRIAPPLTITEQEVEKNTAILNKILSQL